MARLEAPPSSCPACTAGLRCVLHSPLFAELDDPPGIPAGERPRVHETPPALPHRRLRPVPRRPQTLENRVQELEQLVRALAPGLLTSST
jgi:hypothetical protein